MGRIRWPFHYLLGQPSCYHLPPPPPPVPQNPGHCDVSGMLTGVGRVECLPPLSLRASYRPVQSFLSSSIPLSSRLVVLGLSCCVGVQSCVDSGQQILYPLLPRAASIHKAVLGGSPVGQGCPRPRCRKAPGSGPEMGVILSASRIQCLRGADGDSEPQDGRGSGRKRFAG